MIPVSSSDLRKQKLVKNTLFIRVNTGNYQARNNQLEFTENLSTGYSIILLLKLPMKKF